MRAGISLEQAVVAVILPALAAAAILLESQFQRGETNQKEPRSAHQRVIDEVSAAAR